MIVASNAALVCALVVPACLWASWSDCRRHKVPNLLNGLLALTGLAAAAMWGGWAGLGHSTMGLLTGFGLLMGLWLAGAMGAGDVKFLSALGAWLGPWLTLCTFAVAALVGGLFALGLVTVRRDWGRTSARLWCMAAGGLNRANPSLTLETRNDWVMPYALPLSVGALIVLACRINNWWGVS